MTAKYKSDVTVTRWLPHCYYLNKNWFSRPISSVQSFLLHFSLLKWSFMNNFYIVKFRKNFSRNLKWFFVNDLHWWCQSIFHLQDGKNIKNNTILDFHDVTMTAAYKSDVTLTYSFPYYLLDFAILLFFTKIEFYEKISV